MFSRLFLSSHKTKEASLFSEFAISQFILKILFAKVIQCMQYEPTDTTTGTVRKGKGQASACYYFPRLLLLHR